jgi:hypothetical protein
MKRLKSRERHFFNCVCCGARTAAVRYDRLTCTDTCRQRVHRRGLKAFDLYREKWTENQEIIARNLRKDRYGSIVGSILNWMKAA